MWPILLITAAAVNFACGNWIVGGMLSSLAIVVMAVDGDEDETDEAEWLPQGDVHNASE